jgi:hypothetical protein
MTWAVGGREKSAFIDKGNTFESNLNTTTEPEETMSLSATGASMDMATALRCYVG